MADIESIRLANCFDFGRFWSWFWSAQVMPCFFSFIFWKKSFLTNTYQKSASDIKSDVIF